VRRAALLAIAAASAPAAAAANPADLFGFGARGAAMGGAQAAAASDGTANYYNPALLARAGDIRIDVGYQLAAPSLLVDGRDLHVDGSRGVAIDLAVPGRLGRLALAVGTAVFLPDQQLTRIRTLPPTQPRFSLYDNRPQRLLLAANVAIAIGDRLSLGGGIAYMSSAAGTVALRGVLGFPDRNDSDLDLAIDVDLRTIRYPELGAALRVLPWLDVGVTYRGGFRLVIDQAFDLRGDIGSPGRDPIVADAYFKLHSISQDQFQPAQLVAGAWARLTPRLGVAFDLGWHRWSAFENPAAHIAIELDVGEFNDLVDLPPPASLAAAHFADIAVPRLGVEWIAHAAGGRQLLLRAGYVFEPSPAPEQIGESNFIDNDKHTASLGAGVVLPHLGAEVPRPLGLDAFVALTVLAPRDHHKLSPVDPVGDYRSSGRVLSAGLMSRWRF